MEPMKIPGWAGGCSGEFFSCDYPLKLFCANNHNTFGDMVHTRLKKHDSVISTHFLVPRNEIGVSFRPGRFLVVCNIV